MNKSEHKLYLIYPLADWIIRKTPLGKLLKSKNNQINTLKALYLATKAEGLQHFFWCGKVSLVVVIVLVANILALFIQVSGSSNRVLFGGVYLHRPEYGEGNLNAELYVTMERASIKGINEEDITKSLSIQVQERLLTEDELRSIFEKTFHYLEKVVLGDNKSFEQVDTKLNFIRTIPGIPVNIEWGPKDENLITSDGTVNNRNLKKRGTDTMVMVILSCQEKKVGYQMSFHVMPKNYTDTEIIEDGLNHELLSVLDKSATEHTVKLPDQLGDYRLSWSERESKPAISLLLLGLIAAVSAWYFSDKELDQKMKKRKVQLLCDYPELINKLTLLINAGMTVKQAWNRMAEDYLLKAGNKLSKKRYAYEEMLITANELKLGIPEIIAYEHYGRRIGLIPYIKFCSLITQNLKKGTRGFTDLMMREAREAFEERKETAKRLGEEAGTKLLIPMMAMLLMVLFIIMIPAFLTFRM